MTPYADRRSYRGRVKLAVFDWAGTTIDYGCYAPTMAFVALFKQRGIDLSIEKARGPMGLSKRDHILKLCLDPEIGAAWQASHRRQIEESDIDEMYADFRSLQLSCLADYAQLIPGTLECVDALRRREVAIGSTTGYFEAALEIVKIESARQGFFPDSNICATMVKEGRPAPWMIFQNMIATGVYPPEAVVKVDDTIPGLLAGINAGVWTIGVAKTGNEVGLNQKELESLPLSDMAARVKDARETLASSGAHFVVDSIIDVPATIEKIEERLARGEKP